MKVFVKWVLARRYRLVSLATVLGVLFIPIVPTALLTLETLRRGGTSGSASALAGTAGIVALGAILGADAGILAAVAIPMLFAGVALGALVRRTMSMALAFQGSLLVCVLALIGASAIWPDPGILIGGLVEQAIEVFRDSGASDAQLAILRDLESHFFRSVATFAFLYLSGALLLGLWWNAFDGPEGEFGRQFRTLKLGRVLGIPATLLMASTLVLDGPVVENLFPLVLLGFWFQGLAVSHAWARARGWHPAALGLVYVLMVSPLSPVVLLIMGSVGLIDNWMDLRAPLRPML